MFDVSGKVRITVNALDQTKCAYCTLVCFTLLLVTYIWKPYAVFNSDKVVVKTRIFLAESNTTIKSSKAWPDLELFLPLHMKEFREFKKSFFRSFRFFWPKDEQRVVVILDSENRKAAQKKDALTRVMRNSQGRISYNEPSEYYRKGKDRQQLVMFWADNFTDAEYVGFVDADTMFITPVDVADIFEDGKPVIIGNMFKEPNSFWEDVHNGVTYFVGYPSFIRCMSYFPVIIKLQHLIELRHHVEQHKNISFNEAFQHMSSSHRYSQFGIMCTFLWNRHREEYSWHLKQSKGDEGVNQLIPHGSQCARAAWTFGVTPSMLLPKPRVATHTNYVSIEMPNETYYRYILLAGYCLDEKLRVEKLKVCAGFQPYAVQRHFFCFEHSDWSYREDVRDSFIQRQHRRMSRSHEWDSRLLRYLTPRQKNDFSPDFVAC